MTSVEELIRQLDCHDESTRVDAALDLRDLGPAATAATNRLTRAALEDVVPSTK